jgi:aminoglycoside 6'-N-acetyltransferase
MKELGCSQLKRKNMYLYQHDNLAIRLLEKEDASLLLKWLSDPKVLEYYEGRDHVHDLNLVMKNFYEDQEDVIQCIIVLEGREIGYIQFYSIDEEERVEYGYIRTSEVVYGMDQFIGERDCWNQGIGTVLVTSTRDYIISIGANVIVMDPQAWNHRALRCYEKCGFQKVKYMPEHEWHEGAMRDCWLIEYRVSKIKGVDERGI